MDYTKSIKSYLENNDFLDVIAQFKLDKEQLLNSLNNNVSLCSNNSFLFIYLEQSAVFMALSLNRLCKTTEKTQFIDAFQVCIFNINFLI